MKVFLVTLCFFAAFISYGSALPTTTVQKPKTTVPVITTTIAAPTEPKTTTAAPNTTVAAPNTTAAALNTTAAAPETTTAGLNTTEAAPRNTTTAEAPTTTENTTTTTATTTTTPATTTIDPFCVGKIEYNPDPKNCSQFIRCPREGILKGHAVVFPCPSGLIFNTVGEYCDWPGNVICKNGVRPTKRPQATQTPKVTQPATTAAATKAPTTTAKAPTTTAKAPTTTAKAPSTTAKAPSTTAKAATTTAKVVVNTTKAATTTTKAKETTTSAAPTTTTTTTTPTTTTSTTTSDPFCIGKPERNIFPGSCHKYIQCKNGQRKTVNCWWQKYDPVAKKCVHPATVNCEHGVFFTTTTTTTASTTPFTGTTLPTTTPSTTKGICERSGDYYVRDAKDCGKYIHCHGFVASFKTCPHNLVFDLKLNVCNWAINVEGCGDATTTQKPKNTTPKAKPTTTKAPKPTTTKAAKTTPKAPETTTAAAPKPTTTKAAKTTPKAPETTTAAAPKTTTRKAAPSTVKTATTTSKKTSTTTEEAKTTTPKTKSLCDGKSGSIAHPTNCSKYIRCVHGRSIELLCPKGLHFDTKIGNCNWPNRSDCTVLKN